MISADFLVNQCFRRDFCPAGHFSLLFFCFMGRWGGVMRDLTCVKISRVAALGGCGKEKVWRKYKALIVGPVAAVGKVLLFADVDFRYKDLFAVMFAAFALGVGQNVV